MKTKMTPTATFLFIAAFLGMLSWTGCAAPKTTVQTDGQNGTIMVKVEPSHATVEVDGQAVGKAREFDGSSGVLLVKPGKHVVTLKAEGYEDFSTQVYISDTQELVEVQLRKLP
jgi:PEGA domain